jgi:hypothetical protein
VSKVRAVLQADPGVDVGLARQLDERGVQSSLEFWSLLGRVFLYDGHFLREPRLVIDLLKPLSAGAEPLYKVLRDKVFYIRNFMPPSSREKYTQALADYPDNKSTLPIWLLWRPHLEAIVDLRARRVEYAAKREAAARLTARVARRFAEVLRNSYLPRQASVQIQRIWKLRHNEIRRQQLPPVCLDSIEDYRFARQRQELINYADLGVNKDVGFPVRYVQA